MARRYLDSVSGSNTDPYDTLAKAAIAMATVITGASTNLAAGEDVFMTSNHAEVPGASVVYNFPGDAAGPNRVISIDRTDESYKKAENVQIDISASALSMTIDKHVKFYGPSFKIGNDLNFTGTNLSVLFNDAIIELTRASAAQIIMGHADGRNNVEFKKTDVNFSGGGLASGFAPTRNSYFRWNGGLLSWGGAQPTALIVNAGRNIFFSLAGVGLTALTSALVDVSLAAQIVAEFRHCVKSTGLALVTGVIAHVGTRVLWSGVDDTTGNDINKIEYVTYYGSVFEDFDTHRTGGSKVDGNNFSIRMVTTGNAREFSEPLISLPIPVRIRTAGAKVFTINGLWDSAVDIQNDEAWLEIEFLDEAANTQSEFADDGLVDVLAAPVDQTTNSDAWTIVPSMTNANKFELSVVKTVNRVGPAIARIHLARPNTTAFFDAEIEVT